MKLFWRSIEVINESSKAGSLSTKTIVFLYRWLVEEGAGCTSEGLDALSRSLGVTQEAGRRAIEELSQTGLVIEEKRQFSAPRLYRLDCSFVGDEFDNDESKTPFQIAHCLVSHRASCPGYMSKLEGWIEKSKIGITKRVLLSALLSLSTTNGFVLGYSQARLSLITGIPQRSVKLYLKEFSKAGLIVRYPGLPRKAGFGHTSSAIAIKLENMIQGDLVTVYRPDRRIVNLAWLFSKGDVFRPPSFQSALGSSAVWELYLKIMFESPDDFRMRSNQHAQYFDLLARYVASTLICVRDLPEASDALGLTGQIVGLLPSLPELKGKDGWASENAELYAQVRDELDCHNLTDEDVLRYAVAALVVLVGTELAKFVRSLSERDSRLSKFMFKSETELNWWVRLSKYKGEEYIYFCRVAPPQ